MRVSRNKYQAKRCEKDGYKFDSKAEMRRYEQLQLMQRAGKIWGLIVKPKHRYEFVVNGVTVGHFRPDFEYTEPDEVGEPRLITEDVKGYAARDWSMRKRLFLALYGREVREVKA